MSPHLRLSEHPASQQWLTQFRTAEDRARAAQLLNQLKLVSSREFETSVELALTKLQERLGGTIAVYPIAPPLPEEIASYDPFTGGIAKDADTQSRETGRRRKFGSEDRVGHSLQKLQDRFRRGTGSSSIECSPTLTQLKTQGIRHVVLVDDMCGSGKRIIDYWRTIPRRIKSLLSLKRCELWIVLYVITPSGRKALKLTLPNFPMDTHLITIAPTASVKHFLTPDLRGLCMSYGKSIGLVSASLGYGGSASPFIFEHGCPNNAPAILWASKKGWRGLFPNRSIPPDMRACFDDDGTDRALEALWRANQPKLALSLLESIERLAPLDSDHRLMLTLLGLRLRGIAETDVPAYLLANDSICDALLSKASKMGLYDRANSEVTSLGKEFIARFRARLDNTRQRESIGRNPSDYYPSQCEGKLRELGKAG